MKTRLELWHLRNDFKLSEAALLITENNPDDWVDEKLLSEPPSGFKAVYGQMLRDATTVVNEGVESQEREGEFITEYALMTEKPVTLAKLTEKDELSITVETQELLRWLKARKIPARFFDDTSLNEFDITDAEKDHKPLNNRERNTFLVIIAALAKEAKIDITSPSKAGVVIANIIDTLGAFVDSETIAGKLKLIDAALERRVK